MEHDGLDLGKSQAWKTTKELRKVSNKDLYTASQILRTGFLNHPCNLILNEMQENWFLSSYQRLQLFSLYSF